MTLICIDVQRRGATAADNRTKLELTVHPTFTRRAYCWGRAVGSGLTLDVTGFNDPDLAVPLEELD